MLKVRIGAIEFGPDHMHVFVIDCKNYSAAKLAEQLKGYSSYVVRRQCWNDVSKKTLGRPFLVRRLLLRISGTRYERHGSVLYRTTAKETLAR
ncbi:hypothetical protein FHEFKHOI_01284 [Candidatus Methanoperedenaceae archaeon GB50]|nr:hypothetical protein AIOGIFDO_01275 [Candidatus Methanoperedenaceae archaeon GB37]CAD7772769.1 hypothetical protein FHEFKHOI_01284 [Candidatus Methanoperedenaceae archaeon GB50]CAD7778827.1 MAG: hypothetical protein KBONHNOK_01200 [Candidatus Methanoperedenaceae archaeon GB50]